MLDEIHVYSSVAMEYEVAILADRRRQQRRMAPEHANGTQYGRDPTRRTGTIFKRRASRLSGHWRS
jgi:hypothetical protein